MILCVAARRAPVFEGSWGTNRARLGIGRSTNGLLTGHCRAMSMNTTKAVSAATAAAAMTTPAQLELLGGHLRKLRLLKSGAAREWPRTTAQDRSRTET